MADEATPPKSSEDMVRAARDGLSPHVSLSEDMVRKARRSTGPSAAAGTGSSTPGDLSLAVDSELLIPDVETAPEHLGPTPTTAGTPTARPGRARPTRRRPRTDTAPGPIVVARRTPRLVRGLIPLLIVAVIVGANLLDDERDITAQPPAVVTVTVPGPVSTIGVASDEPSVNLARGHLVTASGEYRADRASRAVDGDLTTAWNSGGFPLQWIEIDLGSPATIRSLRLRVGQSPAGETVHLIVGRGPGTEGREQLLHTFQGRTTDRSTLNVAPETPWQGIRYVRVITTESPSWVAWFEIEVLGVPTR